MPKQTFRCQFCDTEYSTFALAEKCEQELRGVDKKAVFDWTDATVSYKPGQGYYAIGTGKVTGIYIVVDPKEKGKHQVFLCVDFVSDGMYVYNPAYMFEKV
jgi:hypothetical protein